MSEAKHNLRTGKLWGYIQHRYKQPVGSFVTTDKRSAHVKRLPKPQRTSYSANSTSSCSSLSYSIQNLSWRAKRQSQDERSHTVSLYCYYCYYYHCLLLFLHSFIALYKLTNASSRFSTHPLAFFPLLFRPFPFGSFILFHYLFFCSAVPFFQL